MTYPYYPQNYPQVYPQPNYYQQQQAQTQNLQQQQTQQAQPQPQMPQFQNEPFVPIPSESDARNFPVQPGKSVSFKDEYLPDVYYSKTMPASQFERPIFKRYRLIEEEITDGIQAKQSEPKQTQIDKSEIDNLKAKVEGLEEEVENIKKKISVKPTGRKKEGVEDE